MISKDQLIAKVLESFPEAKVQATDLTGGGDHWQLSVTSKEFAGLSMVQQHQLVYKALGSWVRKEIHALTLNTKSI